VSVGIETRQPTTQDQHIPTYSGYVFQRWIGGNAGTKWRSAWLDNYEMQGADNDFVAQVGRRCSRALRDHLLVRRRAPSSAPSASNYPYLVERMPDFDRLAGMLDGPARGISIHLPLGSVGEYNIFGYFGMIGLPMAPCTTFPPTARRDLYAALAPRPEPGGGTSRARPVGPEVFLTWPLLQDLRGSELSRALNVISEGGTVASSTFRARENLWDAKPSPRPGPLSFPGSSSPRGPTCARWRSCGRMPTSAVLLKAPYLEGEVDSSICPTTAMTCASARAGARCHPPLLFQGTRGASRRPWRRRTVSVRERQYVL